MIRFAGTEQIRAGKGIQELRRRTKLSPCDFASKAHISADYLTLLEIGHEDKVPEGIVEYILDAVPVSHRAYGSGKKSEYLKRILLSINSPIPPPEEN